MDDLENTIEKKIKEVNQIFEKSFNDNYRLTKLSDSKIGYSIKRDYDEDVVKKLGIIDKKTYTSLTHLSIIDSDLEESNKKKIPVNVEMNCLLFEDVENKFVYNYEYITNPRMKPINISTQAYTLDLLNQKFYKENKKIDLIDIYNEVYERHIIPSSVIKGLPFRTKVGLNKFLIFVLKSISITIGKILEWAYYYEPHRKNFKTILPSGEDNSSINEPVLENERFDFYGYKVSPRTISIYSFFHLAMYMIFYLFNYYPQIIKNIVKYQFLTLIYVISTVTVFSKFVPKILVATLKKLDNMIFEYEFRSFKV